ncbi:MAG TPA: baseplate J/gp47 family protein, partial [Polyangiaceae bacterium]|nr:baseplate J/gp47 family protein [Polyangiaceae bacterium]
MSGLTPEGFIAKTVDEILAELRQSQRSNVDGSLNTSATGVIANLNMAFALELAACWEAIAEVYDAHDPASAEGIAADANGSLVGVPRRPATKALTTLRLTMATSTLVPSGSVVSDPTRPTVRFVTLVDALTSTTSTSVDVPAAAETAGVLT